MSFSLWGVPIVLESVLESVLFRAKSVLFLS